jgi:hypothetical protein
MQGLLVAEHDVIPRAHKGHIPNDFAGRNLRHVTGMLPVRQQLLMSDISFPTRPSDAVKLFYRVWDQASRRPEKATKRGTTKNQSWPQLPHSSLRLQSNKPAARCASWMDGRCRPDD